MTPLRPLSQRASAPARNLDDAAVLCDSSMPLDPEQDAAVHQDLARVRGEDRLASIRRNIRRAQGLPTLHFLSGHTGSGKTTELLRMKHEIETDPRLGADTHVLMLDAMKDLNRQDVDLEDILVGLWKVVADANPKAAERVLAPVWRDQILSALSGLVVNLPAALPDALGKLLNDFKAPAVDQRKRLRTALGDVSGALIDGLNKALMAFRAADSPFEGSANVVFLIDNLEKLAEAQAEVVERLYLERLGALKDLQAHLVITVPLYLCYGVAGASLTARYGGEVVVLPMIKVRERQEKGGGDCDEGLDALVALMALRVDFGLLFEGAQDTAREVARVSGGCIRHALRILYLAISRHDDPPVTVESVHRAIDTLRAEYNRALPEAWIAELLYVVANDRFSDACPPEVKQGMLRHLFVLEYQNGEVPSWFSAHPLAASCSKVQATLKARGDA
ncbi:MAG: AAA family ATPase [Alphaproteobacteria bacterium]|nr:AAA family ATPase [Alphaproteobacteria bacterium]